MSYIFRSDTDLEIGERVVVRRRLPEGFSDIIGHITALAPLTVRPQLKGGLPSEEEPVEIPDEQVHIVRRLSPRTIRNSDIRHVETAYAKAFPGIEHRWSSDGQWLLRAGDGITERSNSATPLGPSAGFSDPPIDEITAFYQQHNLPVTLHLPERIAKPALKLIDASWSLSPEILVMTRPLDHLPPAEHPAELTFSVTDVPDQQWLDMYHFRGQQLPRRALQLLSAEIDGRMAFAQLRHGDTTVAITRATLTESPDGRVWLGYSAVEVAPEYRRKGLGTALGAHILGWGQAAGADAAYLQVIISNEAGISLYRKLGFLEHHRHRYATVAKR